MDTRGIDPDVVGTARHFTVAAGQALLSPRRPGTRARRILARSCRVRCRCEFGTGQAGNSQGFSSGDPNVNLRIVVVNLQKANLSFQQMVQVRNKLVVTAYQDMMNMSV